MEQPIVCAGSDGVPLNQYAGIPGNFKYTYGGAFL
jgi:hypothetical protein